MIHFNDDRKKDMSHVWIRVAFVCNLNIAKDPLIVIYLEHFDFVIKLILSID